LGATRRHCGSTAAAALHVDARLLNVYMMAMMLLLAALLMNCRQKRHDGNDAANRLSEIWTKVLMTKAIQLQAGLVYASSPSVTFPSLTHSFRQEYS